jgi:hypothetical protein
MAMHRHQTPCTSELEARVAVSGGASRLAFGALIVFGGAQVAITLAKGSSPEQALLGAACLVAGLGWFRRNSP